MHTQKYYVNQKPSDYVNKNYSATRRLMLTFMTATHHAKPSSHQIKKQDFIIF